MLDEFSIDTLNDKIFNMTIVGKTNSGKTTLLYYILSKIYINYRHIYFFTTNTIYIQNCQLDNYILKDNRILINKKEDIEIYLNSLDKWLSNKIESGNESPSFNVLIIFDDISNYCKKDLYIYLSKSRHLNMSFIFLLHDMLDLSIQSRQQIQYKIFTNPINDWNRLLDLTDKKNINDITSKINQMNNINKKIYYFYDSNNNEIYYVIIPDNILQKIKNKNINLISKNESIYKTYIINLIEKNLKKVLSE